MTLESFLALPEEKQTRIIYAALREFGRYGYAKTSADQIAKAAEISKGMVFHYFGNKLSLYEYLMDYSLYHLAKYFEGAYELLRDLDYLEQYRELTRIKLVSYAENPYVFEFVSMLFLHPENGEVSKKGKETLQRIYALRKEAMDALRGSANTRAFRKDMDADTIKRYMAWMIEGYSQEIIQRLAGVQLADIDLDPYWKEADTVMDDMRKLFYQKEGKE